MERAFHQCARRTLELAISVEVTEEGVRQLSVSDALDDFTRIAELEGVERSRDFADVFYSFIDHPPKSFRPVATAICTVATTLAYLRKGREIATLSSGMLEGEDLYIDTNVAVQLLCNRTSSLHAVCKETLGLSRELGLTARIYESSVNELARLVDISGKIIRGQAPGVRWLWEENQLLVEFARRKAGGQSGGAAIRHLESFPGLLETVYRVVVTEDPPVDKVAYEERLSTIEEVLAGAGVTRNEASKDHDSRILSYVTTSKREMARDSVLGAPWLLTLDRKLVSVDRLTSGKAIEEQCAILVRHWLSAILPVTEFSTVEEHLDDLSSGWLKLPFVPDATLHPQELADLLAEQVNIDPEARPAFVRAALRHPLQAELQQSIQRRDEETTRALLNKVLVEAVEELSKQVKLRKEEADDLRSRLHKLRERLEVRSKDDE